MLVHVCFSLFMAESSADANLSTIRISLGPFVYGQVNNVNNPFSLR